MFISYADVVFMTACSLMQVSHCNLHSFSAAFGAALQISGFHDCKDQFHQHAHRSARLIQLSLQALEAQKLQPDCAHCMRPQQELQQRVKGSKKRRKAGGGAREADAAPGWEGLVVPDVRAVLADVAVMGVGLVDCISPVEKE